MTSRASSLTAVIACYPPRSDARKLESKAPAYPIHRADTVQRRSRPYCLSRMRDRRMTRLADFSAPIETLRLRERHWQVKCTVIPAVTTAAPVLFHLVLRHVHDHARRQIKPRHDRLELHVLGVVRMRAVALRPKPSITGAVVFSAANAASVPPPVATSAPSMATPISS